MTPVRLAYHSNVLTIVSPCILPVLPFVLAKADGRFLRTGLPLLAGMALTFATVADGWAVVANQCGRVAALSLLALFGVALMFPIVSDLLTWPLVALGVRLFRPGDAEAGPTVLSAPSCSGPPPASCGRPAPAQCSASTPVPNDTGTVTGQRLYQLVCQRGPMRKWTFEIRFLDTGIQAYAFTFG